MTVHWFLLSCAVASNVLANIAFKMTMRSIDGALGPANFLAAMPGLVLGGSVFASAMLLGCYLLALRQIGLSASYAVVTSSALVAISCASLPLSTRG